MDWLPLLVPALALAVAVPLALAYDHRAADAWDRAHRPPAPVRLVVGVDVARFVLGVESLRIALLGFGQSAVRAAAAFEQLQASIAARAPRPYRPTLWEQLLVAAGAPWWRP